MKYIFLLLLCSSCASVTYKNNTDPSSIEEKLNKLTEDMMKLQREMEPRARLIDFAPYPGG